MDNTNINNYEEISLREIIEVLLDGWKLIAIITIMCILVSGIFSFYIIEPSYEAKTTLMASFATDRLTSDKMEDDVEGILDSISTYPTMTIQTYKEQIKNPDILQKTIDQLKLDKEKYDLNKLRNMITLTTIKDTNLIAIKVEDTNPKIASKIANTVANNFTVHISSMAKDQASRSSKFIEKQLEVEKEKLDEALLELKTFLSKPRGVDELNAEVNSKLNLLTSFKTQLVNKEVELNKTKAALTTAKKELENTPKILTTKKSLSEDSLLTQITSEENNLSTKEASQITLENEQINSLYISLKSKISNKNIYISELNREITNIKEKISITKKELEKLQVELAEKEHKERLIKRRVNLAQSTYDSFLNKYEETRIAESSEIGESSVIVTSKAITPKNPVAPNKMLNLAIAAVLGVMIGVFIVFSKHYWETSAEEVKA
ncbi:MAG: hypothetical protein FH751_16900 [Firmicutes bacterium]|nr:hypothetical protein [Bacillota bacterium]